MSNIKNKSMASFLATPSVNKSLNDIVGSRKETFVSNLIALTDSDKNLAACNPADLMKCALNATALDLSLNKNLGHAYVVAYKGVPQFQIGYKGLIQLALRSGNYKSMNSCCVREGEIERNKFTGKVNFIGENPKGEVIGYLAYIEMQNGFEHSAYMTKEQVAAHGKKFSKAFSYSSSPWQTDFDSMAEKTVMKKLLSKYGNLSIEVAEGLANDESYVESKPASRQTIVVEPIEQKENTETKEIEF